MTISSVALTLIAVTAVCFPRFAEAQAGGGRRVPVVIRLTSALTDATFLIKRNPPGMNGDVIELSESSSANDLSTAVQMLMQVRKIDGDTGTGSKTFRLHSAEVRGRVIPILPWANRVIGDLKKIAAAERAASRGNGSLKIWLPPQKKRSAPTP